MSVGLKIANGDIVINSDGTLDIVEQGDKCLRDFGKMLVTDVQSAENIPEFFRYNPQYGSLLNRLSSNNQKKDTVIQLAYDLVYSTIQNYLNLQGQRNNLDIGEIIVDVDFQVYFDIQDSTTLIIPIKVTNAEGLTFEVGEFEERIS